MLEPCWGRLIYCVDIAKYSRSIAVLLEAINPGVPLYWGKKRGQKRGQTRIQFEYIIIHNNLGPIG